MARKSRPRRRTARRQDPMLSTIGDVVKTGAYATIGVGVLGAVAGAVNK